MKRLLLIMALAAGTLPAAAQVYEWTDSSGTVHFCDDPGSIPPRYRKKAKRAADAHPAPVSAPAATAAGAGTGKAVRGGEVQPDASEAPSMKAEYGGRASAAWKSDFTAMNAELATLKEQLDGKRNRLAGGTGLTRDSYIDLQREVVELAKKYADAFRRNEDLVKKADQAGVPNGLRWEPK